MSNTPDDYSPEQQRADLLNMFRILTRAKLDLDAAVRLAHFPGLAPLRQQWEKSANELIEHAQTNFVAPASLTTACNEIRGTETLPMFSAPEK